jgi:flagellar biosynthesis protein FlhF
MRSLPAGESNEGARVISGRTVAASTRATVQHQAATLGAKILDAVPKVLPTTISLSDQGVLGEIKNMHKHLQEQLSCIAWSDMQQRDPKRSRLLRDMINIGFSPTLSSQLLDKMPRDGDVAWLSKIISHNLRVATQQEDLVARGGVYALVGPTGVGKTTTTAKLAARAVVRYGSDKVALITTDSYRIGAHEQLQIYGKILGVSVYTSRDTDDLKLTLSNLKHKHLVLIDTMGVGQRDSRVATQAQMFDAVGVRRLLLLNVTSSGATLDDVVKMYGGTNLIGCIPTKLDEAVTLGTMLDVVVRHKLTLHYLASGQRVPEDLHEVNLEYLLHRAFKAMEKNNAFAMHEQEMPAFMAGVRALPVGVAAAMRGNYAL